MNDGDAGVNDGLLPLRYLYGSTHLRSLMRQGFSVGILRAHPCRTPSSAKGTYAAIPCQRRVSENLRK